MGTADAEILFSKVISFKPEFGQSIWFRRELCLHNLLFLFTITLILIIAVICVTQYLTDKGEHIALYKVMSNIQKLYRYYKLQN